MGGFDRLATVIHRKRAERGAQNVLLLDAGDATAGSMLADLTRGGAVLELMAALHYDAMAVGDHEPDFGADTLRGHIAASRVPMLAANLTERASGELIAQPFLMREIAGVHIGVLGLANPGTPRTAAEANVASLKWMPDSTEAAQRYIGQMCGEGAQIVVVLSHLGLGARRGGARYQYHCRRS